MLRLDVRSPRKKKRLSQSAHKSSWPVISSTDCLSMTHSSSIVARQQYAKTTYSTRSRELLASSSRLTWYLRTRHTKIWLYNRRLFWFPLCARMLTIPSIRGWHAYQISNAKDAFHKLDDMLTTRSVGHHDRVQLWLLRPQRSWRVFNTQILGSLRVINWRKQRQ